MEKLIDLHIHSNTSDGVLTGFEIIDEAIKNNVSIISITDHDDVSVYTKSLFEYAKKRNITLIPGVEISSKYNKKSIHILGYNVNLKCDDLNKTLSDLRHSRMIYLEDVSNALKNFNIIVNVEALNKLEVVTKKDIAVDIVTNKLNEKVLMEKYSYIPSMGEFIETMMNPGCPAFVEKKSLTPKEASNLIKKAGGKVVIAHPVVYNEKDEISFEELKNMIVDINADGIEANYIYINVEGRVINQIDKWNQLAENLNLFVTIGSDFHDYEAKQPLIGLINYDISNVDKEKIINNLTK